MQIKKIFINWAGDLSVGISPSDLVLQRDNNEAIYDDCWIAEEDRQQALEDFRESIRVMCEHIDPEPCDIAFDFELQDAGE